MTADWDGAAWSRERVSLVNRWLEEAVERRAGGTRIREAMHYALMAGGKRLRPLLVLAAGEAMDPRSERWREPAVAVEFIHTYSLIHDDLPAMDDDDLRRGRPTCHKVFGEAQAILAGDALLTEAFGVLAEARAQWPAAAVADAVALLAEAAGARGLVDGQARDLAAEGQAVGLADLEAIHRRKTGALITAAARLPAVLAGQAAWDAALGAYGRHVGLAFQIADDILNVVGDPKMLGKPTGTDDAHDKATYPRLLGLEGARRRAEDEVAAARASLEGLRGTEALIWLATAAVDRER
ncbi:farnesyl diphosphate synthase [Candidatus Hydrogenisulfobacillus filiaventi]|uniref:Farnesyl diphosphate synthase n=1 Tax=Candidatus Hydrogenisulfobacillus filiaventi TaxID=2707344 RepID=A0A6F8ZFE4_9FIRM|nr:polyprenyl synthetase family protein [Bacillota bacterium]CAB1128654.1 farnesyl diphosphate synthase [Candidatus Hydrogenisulfobacillus filiaventi]